MNRTNFKTKCEIRKNTRKKDGAHPTGTFQQVMKFELKIRKKLTNKTVLNEIKRNQHSVLNEEVGQYIFAVYSIQTKSIGTFFLKLS